MGACLHKKVDIGTERELEILGWEDTDSSELNKTRKLEDSLLEKTYTRLPRFLAEKNRVRTSRRKEDRESLRRKERRAAVKEKVERKKSSFMGSDFVKPMSFADKDVDHALDHKKEERKSQNLQYTGVKLTSDFSNVSNAIIVPSKSALEFSNADVRKLTASSEIDEDDRGVMI